MPHHRKGVVIFIKIITLYDSCNKKIGNTYPRRAKQLVLKGQAFWLVEGKSLQIKEEASMIEESAYPAYNKPEASESVLETAPAPPPTPPSAIPETDALLMYRAQQNVKAKKTLVKHIIAFIAAWPILIIFHNGILLNMTHPRWWSASNHINMLQEVQPLLPEEGQWVVQSAISFMTSYFRHSYVPEIWNVILGVMLAWGGWIAFRVAKRVASFASKMHGASKKEKPDPVIQEYNRLKGLD